MAVGTRVDPFRAHSFFLEIDGITRAGFRECTGLDTSTDVVEYREGNEARTPRKLPGLVKYSNITLRWGTTSDSELLDWRQTVANGQIERKNGSIVMLDDTGAEVWRCNFREAWPLRWTGPSFNATTNEVAIETLEIAHEGVQKA